MEWVDIAKAPPELQKVVARVPKVDRVQRAAFTVQAFFTTEDGRSGEWRQYLVGMNRDGDRVTHYIADPVPAVPEIEDGEQADG